MSSTYSRENVPLSEPQEKPDSFGGSSHGSSDNGDADLKSKFPIRCSNAGGSADLEKETLVQQTPDKSPDKEISLKLQKTVTPGAASITPPIAPQPEATYPEGGLRAWLVVFGSFSGMLACFGLTMNAGGVLEAYISTHQLAGCDPSAVGWLFSIYIFFSFFCGLQIGPIFDAKGPRWLIFLGSVFLIAGNFGMASSTQYWHFLLSFSLASGLGTALIFTPAISAIAHFFAVRRGFATGLAATGGSIGGVVFPLVLQRLLDSLGWAWSIRISGFINLFLLCIANLLIRSRLPPKVGGSIWPDFHIFRQLNFAVTTAAVFFMEWGLFVPLTYLTSWALDSQIGSQAFAFQILAILNASSFFGRWIPGYLADRIGRFSTMVIMMTLCALALLVFFAPATFASQGKTPLAVLFALVFGFASGSNISLTPVCVGDLCDVEEYGRYYATCYTIVSIGCLTGLPIAGAILNRDEGNYGGLIAFTSACYAAGTVCFAIVRFRMGGWKMLAKC